ncbi:hypothetical protein [Psychrosphaera aestuarii]|uniref:hypothetical protein n=1 Tax=Psychrosphaera aestuarii TaxID=1266052 RepID=UPI001B328848|nr:hypothetical protein [Psychrosphaera aestuarii]
MKLKLKAILAALHRRILGLHAGHYLILLVVVTAALILLGDRKNIYSVEGISQTITVETSGADINEWFFDNGVLVAEDLFMQPLELQESNTFKFSTNSKLRITSSKNGNDFQLLITARNDKNVGVLVNESESQILTGYVEVLLTISRDFILPFEGKALLGEDVGAGVESLLLEGEVSILESKFISSGRYQGENNKLDMGDRVSIIDNDSEYISKGFVRVTRQNAFYFSVISEGDGVQVTRFGNEEMIITPSIWSRVTKDPVVAAMTSLLALMFLLLEFTTLIKTTLNNKD